MKPSMNMNAELKVLIIEDSKHDTELLLHTLSRAGYNVTFEQVDNLASLRSAIGKDWDLIISDYVLPGFTGLDALKIAQQEAEDIPFIIVSGKIGEEVAVEALKAGAHDYLLKDRLTRLGPAIEKELREAVERRKRKEAEKSLRESEERYRRLVESSPETLFIFSEGKFVYINPAGVNLFGATSPLDLIGRPVLDLVHPDYRDLAAEHMRQTLIGQEGPLVEIKLMRINGESILVEAIARDISYHGQTSAQVICRDISNRKKLEEQAQHVQRMEAIGRLASGVAHDFNNLLTVILGYAGLLRSGLSSNDPLAKDVEQITSSAERAFTLTNQLLTLGRKQVITTYPLNINNIITGARNVLTRMLGEEIQLVTLLSPEIGVAKVDPSQLENVLLNLAVYARDTMPNGGKLIIETTLQNITVRSQRVENLTPGTYVVILVKDTGVGIPESVQPYIFEPFFESSELGKNVGLGLATAYGIIKQHGGHLAFSSQYGKGSTFQIYLPSSGEGNTRATTQPMMAPPPKIQKPGVPTVLLVEDEEVLRSFAQLVLRKNGFNVIAASDGQEGLDKFQTCKTGVDIIFTDIVMPHLSGPELTREITKFHPDIPVLYTSGYTRNVALEYGLDAANLNFLQKPYTAQSLLDRIRELLAAR